MNSDLQIETYTSAACPKSEQDSNQPSSLHGFFGGAYTAEGVFIEKTRNIRAAGIPTVYPHGTKPSLSSQNKLEGKTLFAGPIYSHFGHFLLESTSRLWPVTLNNYDWIYFQSGIKDDYILNSYQKYFFENLGIIDKVVIDNGPTEFAHLDVPDPAFVLEGASDEQFLNVFNKIRDNNANNSSAQPKKLYLSRSKLETGTTVGEIFLENAFVRAGYESIYMESLTPQQQIQLFSIATHVAGIQGSAFHSLLFAPSETKSIVIVREPTTLPTFETIDKLRKIDSLYVGDVMEVFEEFPQVHAQGPYIIDFEKLLSQNTQNELGEILSDVLVPERGELLEHFEKEWAYCHMRNGKIEGDLATSRDAVMEGRTRFEKLTNRN